MSSKISSKELMDWLFRPTSPEPNKAPTSDENMEGREMRIEGDHSRVVTLLGYPPYQNKHGEWMVAVQDKRGHPFFHTWRFLCPVPSEPSIEDLARKVHKEIKELIDELSFSIYDHIDAEAQAPIVQDCIERTSRAMREFLELAEK